MTVERSRLIYIGRDDWDASFSDLADRADRCGLRQSKAAPGDRREEQRYASYCRQIEAIALHRSGAGAFTEVLEAEDVGRLDLASGPRHPWWMTGTNIPPSLSTRLEALREGLLEGGRVVEVRDAFGSGATTRMPNPPGPPVTPVAPAAPWRPPNGEQGLKAVAIRWERQLASAVATGGEPIVPSGVSNRVLTEGLRTFVDRQSVGPAIAARVVYRDGSEAVPFPLRSLSLTATVPEGWEALRFTLISMRHPEMDADIDAAWLRNRDISQVRPAAETDAIVYAHSLAQLGELAEIGPRVVTLYQTGLESAIVGFYRALVEHLRERPGSVVVVPRYFRRSGGYEDGSAWGTTT